MPAIDPALTDAYETCRRMHRRHDPTYYWATRRLPADVRPATHALYGYVRTADQIVDGPRRPPTPEARRAALDALEAELRRARNGGGGTVTPVVGALVDAAGRHDLPLDELGPYMRSMRVDCAPVRIASVGGARALHAGLRRLGGPDHGAAAGRRARPPRRLRPPRRGLPAQRTSSATCARTGAWTGSTSRPTCASASASPRPTSDGRARRPELRALVAHEVDRARRLFAAAAPAIAAAPASVRPGVRLAVRRLRAGARPRRGRRLRRAGPRRRRAPAGDLPRARRAGGAAVTRRATLRGAERTPLDGEAARADVLICGASFAGLAVARELAGAGADVLVVDRYEIGERATSACAAPTPWLEAMGVRARPAPGAALHGLPHPARLRALPAAVELDGVRLPRAVPGAVGAG